MDNTEILYIVVGVILVLYAIVIFVAMKCAHRVSDDFEFYNDDGDHIYYDRKLIREKSKQKK